MYFLNGRSYRRFGIGSWAANKRKIKIWRLTCTLMLAHSGGQEMHQVSRCMYSPLPKTTSNNSPFITNSLPSAAQLGVPGDRIGLVEFTHTQKVCVCTQLKGNIPYATPLRCIEMLSHTITTTFTITITTATQVVIPFQPVSSLSASHMGECVDALVPTGGTELNAGEGACMYEWVCASVFVCVYSERCLDGE